MLIAIYPLFPSCNLKMLCSLKLNCLSLRRVRTPVFLHFCTTTTSLEALLNMHSTKLHHLMCDKRFYTLSGYSSVCTTAVQMVFFCTPGHIPNYTHCIVSCLCSAGLVMGFYTHYFFWYFWYQVVLLCEKCFKTLINYSLFQNSGLCVFRCGVLSK